MNKKLIISFIILILALIGISNNFSYEKINAQELIEYNENVEILSFETLMSFPEKALNENNSYNTLYDENKITTLEFENILTQLYDNGYVLIDIFELIDKEKLTQKKLFLPQNKKPIIFIFNNVSYKSNYQNLGQIDKIIIDRNNTLASYTTKKSIQDRIQYNNEFMLILENFINSHKDFSFNNARGIMFFSGENGILGYNTNSKNTSSKYEKKRVAEVIKKLKNLGWKFGANNYTFGDENLKNNLAFAKDLSLWNSEIKSTIGETNLYSFSNDISSNFSDEKMELLIKNGFNIFFENSDKNSIKICQNICFISSKKVSGNSLRNTPHIFENLFNSSTVYDHNSRLLKYSDITEEL